MANDYEEINLRDYLIILKKGWRSILVIFLIMTSATGLGTLLRPKTFQATALIKIGTVHNRPLEKIENLIVILKEEPAMKGVELSRAKEAGLNKQKETDLLRIKAKASSPKKAVDLVKAASEIILQRHQKFYETGLGVLMEKEERLKGELKETISQINILKAKIRLKEKTLSEAQARIISSYIQSLDDEKDKQKSIQRELEDIKIEKAYQTEPTKMETEPVLPKSSVSPNLKLNLIIAGILGLFMGIFFAFAKEWWKHVLPIGR